jgi:dephospho-CoA kinase
MPGAGKEEFVKVAIEGGFSVIRMGDVVWMEASERGISSDDQGVGAFVHAERQIHGYDIWARRTVERIARDPTIIDGCRNVAEIDIFRREFGDDVRVIGLHASPRTRYMRLVERDRADAPQSWEEFQERDRRELGWGLGKVIVLADHMIINENDLDTFRNSVKDLLLELGKDEI